MTNERMTPRPRDPFVDIDVLLFACEVNNSNGNSFDEIIAAIASIILEMDRELTAQELRIIRASISGPQYGQSNRERIEDAISQN